MSKNSNNVGVIKEIDRLGRIVIPKEFRSRLNLEKNVEIVLTDDGILIRNSRFTLVERSTEKNKSGSN